MRADGVDVVGRERLLWGERLRYPEVQVVGVVDHDVEAALLLDDPGHGPRGRRLRQHIEFRDAQLTGRSLGREAEGVGAAVDTLNSITLSLTTISR